MRTTYWKWLVSVSLIMLLGYSVVRWWQRPQVKVHEVMSRGLVQTVVASGRISNQVRVDISSELTGLVQQRLVNNLGFAWCETES
ncbi:MULTISPECIES: efflux RND transporter periplasmic adaptor subunit [Pseudidiomarina]|uniref:efflux RND transporter periplasmic adaptor subunit n=1 Tax=Pseudidiomarina TaxID=2800384 RepID=UPI0011B24EA8|nr:MULTISPECIES: efflux RND transporter periplasmic adaptor subunit [Pseudidiomarina]